jgi:hypothetical protein
VISKGLWQRRVGGNLALIGKAILLGGQPYVVGVIGSLSRPDPPAELWFPLQADPNSTNLAGTLHVAARLRPGVGGIHDFHATSKLFGGESLTCELKVYLIDAVFSLQIARIPHRGTCQFIPACKVPLKTYLRQRHASASRIRYERIEGCVEAIRLALFPASVKWRCRRHGSSRYNDPTRRE